MEIIKENFDSTQKDIDNTITDYTLEMRSHCLFCGSYDLDYPFFGYEMCNDCGMHTLYGKRFPYLEVTRELLPKEKPTITKEKIMSIYEEVNGLYDVSNKIEGSKYYMLGLLVNEINKEKLVEKL